MNSVAPKQIDGRPGLFAFARQFHPRHEHTIVDLEKLLRRIGFEVTDVNEERIILAGPFRTTTACRTLVLFGGAMRVRHFALVKALERLTETGSPIWAGEFVQFEWHCKQLEQCASFQIPVPEEFGTWEEMQAHVESCAQCQPAYQALVEAVNRGSSRTGDAHLRELIESAHQDAESARKFYEQVRDSQWGVVSSTPVKPGRSKSVTVPTREVGA